MQDFLRYDKTATKTWLLCFALFFMPYICFLDIPISTWRLINVGFVGLSMVFWRRLSALAYFLLGFHTIYLLAMTWQTLGLYDWMESYNMIFFMSAVFFVLFDVYFVHLLSLDSARVIKTLKWSSVALVVYQIFQIAVYPIAPGLEVLFNDKSMVEGANFYRRIGEFVTFPGFMVESGQLALFIGPLLSFLLIDQKYKHSRTHLLFYLLIPFSLLMTLSGGGFMQLVMFLCILLLYQFREKRYFILLTVLAIAIGAVILVFTLFPLYTELIAYKFATVFTDENSRNSGTLPFWAAFFHNPVWGLRPGAAHYIVGDPNLWLPVILSEHGALGMWSLFLGFVLPFAIIFRYSTHKLYALPTLQMAVHLSLTYGTYLWPFLWIIYVLCFYRLAHGLRIEWNSPGKPFRIIAPEDFSKPSPKHAG